MSGALVPGLILVAAVSLAAWSMLVLAPPTLQLGVRVPPDRTGEPIIAEVRRSYRGSVLIGGLVAAATTIAISLVAPVGVATAAGVVTVVVIQGAIYSVFHRRLARVKAAETWYAGQRIGTAGALQPATRTSHWAIWLVPAVVIAAATAAIGAFDYSSMPARLPVHFQLNGGVNRYMDKSIIAVFWPIAVQLFTTLILASVLLGIPRSRLELDPAAPEASFERQQRFREAMTTALGVFLLGLNLSFMVMALVSWDIISGARWAILPLTLTLSLVPAAIMIVVAIRMGADGSRLRLATAPRPGATGGQVLVQRDDDRFWKGGIVYWNPKDPGIFVSKRFGIGWTVNFAKPIAWLFLAALLAIAVAMVLVSRSA